MNYAPPGTLVWNIIHYSFDCECDYIFKSILCLAETVKLNLFDWLKKKSTSYSKELCQNHSYTVLRWMFSSFQRCSFQLIVLYGLIRRTLDDELKWASLKRRTLKPVVHQRKMTVVYTLGYLFVSRDQYLKHISCLLCWIDKGTKNVC